MRVSQPPRPPDATPALHLHPPWRGRRRHRILPPARARRRPVGADRLRSVPGCRDLARRRRPGSARGRLCARPGAGADRHPCPHRPCRPRPVPAGGRLPGSDLLQRGLGAAPAAGARGCDRGRLHARQGADRPLHRLPAPADRAAAVSPVADGDRRRSRSAGPAAAGRTHPGIGLRRMRDASRQRSPHRRLLGRPRCTAHAAAAGAAVAARRRRGGDGEHLRRPPAREPAHPARAPAGAVRACLRQRRDAADPGLQHRPHAGAAVRARGNHPPPSAAPGGRRHRLARARDHRRLTAGGGLHPRLCPAQAALGRRSAPQGRRRPPPARLRAADDGRRPCSRICAPSSAWRAAGDRRS